MLEQFRLGLANVICKIDLFHLAPIKSYTVDSKIFTTIIIIPLHVVYFSSLGTASFYYQSTYTGKYFMCLILVGKVNNYFNNENNYGMMCLLGFWLAEALCLACGHVF